MTDVIDIDFLADELEARRKRKDRGPERYEPGCRDCGVQWMPDFFDGTHFADGRCARCRYDRAVQTDREYEYRMMRDVLRAVEPLRFWDAGQALDKIGGFPFFGDVEAEPSPDTRFAYLAHVLPERLVKLAPPAPPPLEPGPVCQVCGSKDRWRRHEGPVHDEHLCACGFNRDNTARNPGAKERAARRVRSLAGLKRVAHGAQLAEQLDLRVYAQVSPKPGPGEPWHWWPLRTSIQAVAWHMFGRESFFRTPELAEAARREFERLFRGAP